MDHVVNVSHIKLQLKIRLTVSIQFVMIDTKYFMMGHVKHVMIINQMFPGINVVNLHAVRDKKSPYLVNVKIALNSKQLLKMGLNVKDQYAESERRY